MASTAPAHDAELDAILATVPRDRVLALDEHAIRARCDSPRFRRGPPTIRAQLKSLSRVVEGPAL